MRHRRRGRRLGRNSAHRKAMFRNMASSLFLTERDDDAYEFMYQADGKTTVKPPKHKGRIVTTLEKAKEIRSFVEKCITLSRKVVQSNEAAKEFEAGAERNTEAWKAWRTSDKWQQWVAARSAGLTARRRLISILDNKEAIVCLIDNIAPRFMERPGGYTRILRLAERRLGDAGQKAILELVGKNDRSVATSTAPSFEADATEEEETAVAAQ